MKLIRICLIITFIIPFTLFCQSKSVQVVIGSVPKTVPKGKIWKLTIDKPITLEFSNGSSQNGTLCNALLTSIPGIAFNVNSGNSFLNIHSYGIAYKEINKLAFTNDFTYIINPIGFVDTSVALSEVYADSSCKNCLKELIFLPDESVFTGNCIVDLLLEELTMPDSIRKALEIKEKLEIAKRNELKLNFKIPINPEKYVGSDFKPKIKDSAFSEITFSSNAVLFKRPGKSYAVDDKSVWTLILNTNTFTLISSNGINKEYHITEISYDTLLKMQKFIIGDINLNSTHILHLAYSENSSNYTVLLSSLDGKEEYQFQYTIKVSEQ